MTPHLQRPVFILAAMGAASGMLGTQFLGAGFGQAPDFGIYMIFTGVWFGLVIGYAVWRWGNPSWTAAATAVLGTWIGWEAAVNLALQIDRPWPDASPAVIAIKPYLSGFAAGAIGALLTWAGAATCVPAARRMSAGASMMTTGALFGLLLPLTNNYDSGVVLLVPWQMAVAVTLGLNLLQAPYAPPGDGTLVTT